jgi:hypothetical protein
MGQPSAEFEDMRYLRAPAPRECPSFARRWDFSDTDPDVMRCEPSSVQVVVDGLSDLHLGAGIVGIDIELEVRSNDKADHRVTTDTLGHCGF